MKRPRVALFTPLPPAKTGTADYGASLAAELEKLVSLKVYKDAPVTFDPGQFNSVVIRVARPLIRPFGAPSPQGEKESRSFFTQSRGPEGEETSGTPSPLGEKVARSAG